MQWVFFPSDNAVIPLFKIVLFQERIYVLNFQLIVHIRETSAKMYSHFKSDIVNDMDHMRISGTAPSSVILSKTK